MRVCAWLLMANLVGALGCPQLLDDRFVGASDVDAGALCVDPACRAVWSGRGAVAGDAGSSASQTDTGGSGGQGARNGGYDNIGGSPGMLGSSGSAGSGGTGAPPCTGCLELRVPLARSNDTAYFQLAFGQPGLDLHATVATFRVRAPFFDAAGLAYLRVFANDSEYTFGQGTLRSIDSGTFGNTQTFIDVPLDVGAISSGGFDATHVVAIGIQIGAASPFQGALAPRLLLDSISYTGASGLQDLKFTTDAQGFAVNPDTGLQTAEVIHY